MRTWFYIFGVFILAGISACTSTTSPEQNQPQEEVFWRIAQESLLPGERIESLIITRMAECQLSENTKASFGWISEWSADFELVISYPNGTKGNITKEMTRAVHLQENGAWTHRSGIGAMLCTDP